MESTPKQSFEAVQLHHHMDNVKQLDNGTAEGLYDNIYHGQVIPPSKFDARKQYRKRRLLLAISLCLVLFTLECVGAFLSQSLAIWADAFHMLSDVLGYLVSYVALGLSGRRDAGVGYGWKRVEVVGALASVTIMWMLAGNLMWEAVVRLFLLWEGKREVVVEGKSMLAMAIGGVFVNAGMVLWLF
jgi:zinc transporter 2